MEPKRNAMELDANTLKAVASKAKTQTDNARWKAPIDKALAGVEAGWILTEMADSLAITTEGGTYFANGICQCAAFHRGQPCKHRALARLVELHNNHADTMTNGQLQHHI